MRLVLPFLVLGPLMAQVNVLTYQYDNGRSGTNAGETLLTPANVNQNQFGKVRTFPVDGNIYGQPLYLAAVGIGGVAHNAVIVATEHDSVYAFDADSSQTLWQVSFLTNGATSVPSSDVSCGQITPEIGITGTPVIDPSTATIFVVAMTKESGNYVQRLHALNASTGADLPGSPVVIQGSVPGSGDGGNTVTFVPENYKQRPGLLLLNGVVYIGMSSHCDIGTYHGWLFGYDAHTLQQVSIYNATPNGAMASFWQGGAAPAADSNGNIFLVSGNGTFDAASGGTDLGESYIKLNSGSNVADYFTPFNFASLDQSDLDTGSAGVAFLGDEAGSSAHPHLMAGAGKEGRVYLIDRDNMGQYNSGGDQVVQSIAGTLGGPFFGNPAYFDGWVYFCASGSGLTAYPVSNATLGTPVVSPVQITGFGCVPTISANGTSNAVLWAIDDSGTLRAFDATNVGSELWDSNQNSGRDSLTTGAVKFSVPAVANGQVFVGTQSALVVYGLLSPNATTLTILNSADGEVGVAAPGSLISITGSNLASKSAGATELPLPLTLGGASVSIAGVAAPLQYASSGQINAQVPFETPLGPVTVTLGNGDVAGLTIVPSAPAIFAMTAGQAAISNQNGSMNSSAQPAPAGSVVAVYLTGLGIVAPGVGDGTAGGVNPLSYVNAPVTATVGGQPAQVFYAGLAPGFVGLYQVNIEVPTLSTGSYPVQIVAGGAASNVLMMNVK